ncbi:hypothetical protein LSCM1_07936 [Leishmania martiniquensis]|uniref:Uncharacterized protein n=1 Tax=Leishmania martiniquensis TaxID=1580590 RepID=A0A836L2T6_9TRYP|nr:hypothetical protein LSCM1_07936 [Leishmania martiniquensis]
MPATPVVYPKGFSRLDALPGSLGKVSLCAAVMLGIAAYVNLRRWLARRATASAATEGEALMAKWGQRKGAPKEAIHSGRPRGAGAFSAGRVSAGGSSTAGGGFGSNDGKVAVAGLSIGAEEVAAAGSAPPSQRPLLPPRNYFTIRASMHVKRHSAKLMEWYDAQLGIQVPFSPVFFELKQEERQAPLILLNFRTVRESAHRMAVTIEELYEREGEAAYSEASLRRIADCANILAQTTARIGSKDYPVAEYCYVDEHQSMNFVFSAFVVHERLAVTVQYVAPTRARSVMPTAVYDIVRLLAFATPSPSPSYLLVSEPRLGLGYHLPLDFLVHEGLAESDGIEDRLFTSAMSTGCGGPMPAYPGGVTALRQHTRGAEDANGSAYSPYRDPSYYAGYGGDADDDGVWMVPYATAMSRGGRRMGLITSYEPANIATAAGFPHGADNAETGMGGSGVPYVWRRYLEQQVCKAVRQLGLVLGSSGDSRAPQVVFQGHDPAHPPSQQTLLVEPYPLSIALNGNFCAGDDVREEESDAVAPVTAFSLFREVRVDANSAYLTLVPDALESGATAAAAAAARSRASAGAADSIAGTVKAYWSAFYVPVGGACVSFHFIASALRHASTEFVSFCAAVMNSVSLGNHYGQCVSVLYCNTRHDVLPFRLSLPPTGMATVEEPMLADPLCVVQATYGVEKVGVTVRVFPLFTSTTSSAEDGGSGGGSVGGGAAVTAAADGRPPTPCKVFPSRPVAERRGTRQRSLLRQLQYMIRYYLSQYPGGVHVVSQERTTMNSMPAIRVCFKPLWYAGDAEEGGTQHTGGGGGSAVPPGPSVACWEESGGGGGSSQVTSDWAGARDALLEEEVGQLNPFAQYFPPPPPPACYLWGQQQQPRSASPPAGTIGRANVPVTASSLQKAAATGTAAIGSEEASARDDHESRPFYGPRGDESQRSQGELDDPLRVAIAVCCEGNAFLFQASASEYTLGMSMQAVQTLATYLTLIPRSN